MAKSTLHATDQTTDQQRTTLSCKKVFAYVRVSTDGQVEGDGLSRQEAAIREHAASNNLEVVRVFADAGVSGKVETLDRPAFKAMIDAIGNTGVSTVVIEKLDRLSRDLLVAELALCRVFAANGIELLSTMEPDLMSSEPSRVFIRQVLSAVAQLDRSMICHRLSVARRRIRDSGRRCDGQRPYSVTSDGQLALNRIQALRAGGMGFDKIAQHLQAENIPTKREGTRWHGSTVNKMLRGEPL
jgi:DNA invertase Pin-like site-specific DNA recombinase